MKKQRGNAKMFEKEIAEFKAAVVNKKNDPDIDHRKPKRKALRLEIRVVEKEDKKANLELFYDQQYYRMFGQHDTVWQPVLNNVDLKTACDAARELKQQLNKFSIVFLPYEPMELI